MSGPSAKVIADSLSPGGHRLTTIEVTWHRFVHSEGLTHRVFSRNAASSRAIPVQKMIQRVIDDPAIPLSWPREQKGMQGGEELTGAEREQAECCWLAARDSAVFQAKQLVALGVHKSIVNRVLEPFSWITVIISATEWDGFWAQRCHPDAMPELRVAAEAMKAAYDASIPTLLEYGQYHLPYIQPDERETLKPDALKCISAARCARVSYLTHDGKRDIESDLGLYAKLTTAKPEHASPLEHPATPAFWPNEVKGNFKGWNQLRHEVLGK